MKHIESTIVALIKKLNHEFWLPAIQRKFVWKGDQICELFDSVMREYPIGSFLVWRTKNEIRKRKFVEIWKPGSGIDGLFLAADSKEKQLVLDGQQRIQSFYIGLLGRFGKKTLHFNLISGDRTRVKSVIQKSLFEFEFMEEPRDWNWVRVESLLESNQSSTKISERYFKETVPEEKKMEFRLLILENIVQLIKVFKTDSAISYQLLDGTEEGTSYDENDVVEVFVRANSGGTKLQKSELLFALLSSNWDSAGQRLEELETDLAEKGFAFTQDYFLKVCLILLEKKAQYDIKKFRDTATLKELQNKWDAISAAITDVVDFLPQFTPIANSKSLPHQNALLPLIAYRYFQPKGWKSQSNLKLASSYLIRTAIAGSTGSGSKDDMWDALTDVFRSSEDINLEKVYSTIKKKGRSTSISKEQFFNIKYKNNRVNLIMKLLRPDLDFVQSNQNNLPTIDHLISRKLLKAEGIIEKEQVDQLANLVALTADENQNNKRALSISEWLNSVNSADRKIQCKRLYLPTDETLWEPNRFADFITARKSLIAEVPAIKELLGEAAEDEDESVT
jgi:hypothetical protein